MSLSKCPKLKQGQLLMGRYKYVYDHSHGKYKHVGERCKERSLVLAKRMVAHAQQCPTCQLEGALDNPNFYGVDE